MSAAHQLSSPLTLDYRSRSLAVDLSTRWRAPERLPLSTWSERNIVLSNEYSARSGANWRLHGWQREIFDSFTDPYVRGTVCCVGIQLVKSLFIQCAVAYVVDQDPGPILLVQPTLDDGKEFSKERITPMIRDCPCLRGKISDSIHDSQNTILGKSFPGGRLSVVSSQKPGNMARRSIRYGFFDEIDKYPRSADKKGNPIEMAKGRLVTFMSRAKWIETCSPTTAGESAILDEYAKSDQRKPWVTCPKCQHSQLLCFDNVKFDKKLAREKIPDSAYYLCANQACGAHWNDNQRWAACDKAVWKAEKPFAGIAGFWISHIYSPYKKLSQIVDHFYNVKDNPAKLQVFVNEVLAEPWEQKGETPDAQILYSQREDYPHSDEAIVPQRGLFLTAAVDVQDSPPRLECEVKAWGRKRESWSIGYFVLQVFAENGQALPVTSPELWDKLDADILQRDWLHESGNTLAIRVMAIDTGSRPKPVYEFAKKHSQIAYTQGTGLKVHAYRTVVPVKGNDDPLKIISSVSKEDASRKRQNIRIVVIGTHCAKQQIYDNLRAIKPSKDGTPKPGCFHHPMYEQSYFDQLCSEYRIVKEDNSVEYVKRADVRNEALDCFDAATEVLTKTGWKHFVDLHELDDVATVNLVSDSIEYQRPTHHVRRYYSGEMVELKGHRLDVLVTPNHRMVTYKKENHGKGNTRKWNFDVAPKITLAKDLTIHHQLKMGANWYGDNSWMMTIPASRRSATGTVIQPERTVDKADMAELLGWYLAEGNCAVNYSRTQKSFRYRIGISQNEGPKLDRIKELLAKLPWKWHEGRRNHKNKVMTCASRQLFDFLSDGSRNKYNKRVPDWLKQSSTRVISRFMEAAILGDGWQQRRFRTVCTVSKELADGYQECLLKMGRCSNIAVRHPGPCTISSNPNGKVVPQYNVSELRRTKASLDGGGAGHRKYLGKLVSYAGMVYCATVPNGTLICRRNGRAFVAGNCAVYNLAAASIAGIERMTEAYWLQLEASVKPVQVDDETEGLTEESPDVAEPTDKTFLPTAQVVERLQALLGPRPATPVKPIPAKPLVRPPAGPPVRRVRGRLF